MAGLSVNIVSGKKISAFGKIRAYYTVQAERKLDVVWYGGGAHDNPGPHPCLVFRPR